MASADLLNVDRPEAGDVDQARRELSIVRLKQVGVLNLEHLPCEVMEARLL